MEHHPIDQRFVFQSATPTVRSLLAWAMDLLRPASTTPRLDAELLLAHVLGWSRARLIAEGTAVLAAHELAAFQQLVARRAAQEPVAYLIGHREFYGLDLLVDARVLVPRPETELAVDMALAVAAELGSATMPLCIADIGTGSGAIAIALAMHLPTARIYATDASADALAVATENVARHHVEQQVILLQGDLLTPVPEPLHLIVSNPPYTLLDQIDPDVYRYQPHLALDGGPDGLALYRRLAAQLPGYLHPHGAVVLEIGAWQAADVVALLAAALPQAQITVHRDLAERDRVVVARCAPITP